jgi:hypothetical protein
VRTALPDSPAEFLLKSKWAAGLAAVVLTLGWASPGAAEPVHLFAGSINLDSEGGLFYSLAGPGFVAQRDFAPFGWADTGLDIGCFTEGGCGNGELASFTTSTFENVALGRGDAMVGDNSYVDVAFRGTWSLTSPGARLPDTPDQFALLTAPFSFTGTLIGSIGGRDLFESALTGNGMARVFVARTGPGGWQIDEANAIQYLFADSGPAPVPEPGTLLLGALGLCGLAACRRKRSLTGCKGWDWRRKCRP